MCDPLVSMVCDCFNNKLKDTWEGGEEVKDESDAALLVDLGKLWLEDADPMQQQSPRARVGLLCLIFRRNSGGGPARCGGWSWSWITCDGTTQHCGDHVRTMQGRLCGVYTGAE